MTVYTVNYSVPGYEAVYGVKISATSPESALDQAADRLHLMYGEPIMVWIG